MVSAVLHDYIKLQKQHTPVRIISASLRIFY